MQTVIVAILIVVTFLSRMKWRIATLNLIYYMEKKQYKLPDENELKECTGVVVNNIIKDLVGH